MIGGLLKIGSIIFEGVSDHYKDKREIKKIEVETTKKVIVAEAEAKIEMAKNGQLQDFDLDMEAVKNMKDSWKDEVILLIFLIPLVLCFIPGMDVYVATGFQILGTTPEWYRYTLIGMIVVIYGMRGMLKQVMSIMLKKFSK